MSSRGGGIRKRRGGNHHGDTHMGGTGGNRGGQGGQGGRGWRGGRGGRGSHNPAVDQVIKVLTGASGGQSSHNHHRNQNHQNNHSTRGGLEQISIVGWKQSKAASNPGGCQKQLADFLVKKAIPFNTSANKDVKIIKVCLKYNPSVRSASATSSSLVRFRFKPISQTTTEITRGCRYRARMTCNFKVYMPC